MGAQQAEGSFMLLPAGTRVRVRNQFDGSWAPGFTVEGRRNGGYLLRRLSDRTVLPVAFPEPVVRPDPAAG